MRLCKSDPERRVAIARGHRFAGYDKLRARIIEAIMCDLQEPLKDIDT
ncbi:hypothetical protein [Roseobacter sp.]